MYRGDKSKGQKRRPQSRKDKEQRIQIQEYRKDKESRMQARKYAENEASKEAKK